MMLVHVFVEHPILHLDHTFTYLCGDDTIQKGVRVQVPFGNTSIIGFVEKVEIATPEAISSFSYPLKEVESILDQEPLLNEELFELADWMAKTYIAPRISCFQCMLPAKLKPSSTHGSIKMEAYVRVVHEVKMPLTKKQLLAYETLKEHDKMLRSIYYQQFKSPGKKLIELGLVEVFELPATAALEEETIEAEKELTKDQKNAMQRILGTTKSISLLHGVTGSGKTEVFLQLSRQILNQGKQVVVLVPEISLTPQMVQRVKSRFGKRVAIYHSALNNQEKYEQYQLVKNHEVNIVVGTRSAVFMPFDHLGLIIIDEEHDTSYKQDSKPQYHCRDVAIWRSKYHHAKLVLASATPSLESYARAYKGNYELITMPHRINENFPKVTLVEMKKAVANKESYMLSNILLDGIYQRLQKKEQVILLLNRRGYTPILRCISCGHVQMCPHCDVAMSFHKEEQLLKCHTCGCSMPVPTHCPECGQASWTYLGLGTQKLEEFVQIKFPNAKILRMDADTTGKKHSHEQILKAFGEKQADILLGTQMIAKGLDFENVTLVGIVNGDAMLNRSDYRSTEMTYDLLEQASGRSGRGDKPGEVIIQAYDPSHYAIQCAAHHDYLSFFKNEMQFRHLAGYPPYRYLVSFIFSHKKEDVVKHDVAITMSILKMKENCKVLGPASLQKRKDEYRMRILIKGKDDILLNHYAREVYQKFLQVKAKSRLDIDVSPIVME